MRKIVTVDGTKNELPSDTTFAAGSAMEAKVLGLVPNNEPKVLFVSNLTEVPAGTPAETLIVVVG